MAAVKVRLRNPFRIRSTGAYAMGNRSKKGAEFALIEGVRANALSLRCESLRAQSGGNDLLRMTHSGERAMHLT